MEINKSHDKFFKEFFKDTERAAELIKIIIPDEIDRILDYKSIKAEDNSFISKEMSEFQSDILFSLKTTEKSDIKVYLLFEHKSYPDKKINQQLLSYLTNIYLKMEKLSPVIPIIFYHGKKKWEVPLEFINSFNFTEKEKLLYSRYIPDFRSEILDLSSTDIKKVISSLTLKAILYTFKNIWDFEDEEKFKELILLSKDLFYEESGLKIIQKLILYLFSVNDLEVKKTADIVSNLIPYKKGEEIMTTTAERLINQGLEEGANLTTVKYVRKMLQENMPIDFIERVTGLSSEEISELKGE